MKDSIAVSNQKQKVRKEVSRIAAVCVGERGREGGGGGGTCAEHWPNNKHLFDRGVCSIAAHFCPGFFFCASIRTRRSCLPALSLHYSITGWEPLPWKVAAVLAQWLGVWVCVCAAFEQMAYECFSGTRKCGSGDMIPMDELGPGKSQTAWLSSAKDQLALL